jgi:uncharacterized protein (TIGR02597 family)
MRTKLFSYLTGVALAIGSISASAQSASVATVPTGMITFTLGAGTATHISLPLAQNATYTGSVSAVSTNSISVGDSPAPFVTNLATPATPYFIKMLSGNEIGRVMLITGNTASSVTLDTSDNTPQTVSLITSGFNVAVGDTFEIFPGDTLSSIFGTNTSQSPLILTASTTIATADCVSIYNTMLFRYQTYFFNTTAGCWELDGSTANANNTIIYPYAAVTVSRLVNNANVSLVLTGRVAEVPVLTKTVGDNTEIVGSTGYPTNMTLSQLQFGSNWVTGTSAITANTVNVWNTTLGRYDTFYQLPDSTWRKLTDTTTDQSNFVIPAGTAVAVLQRSAVSGASSFLPSTMPYSLN